MAPSIRYWDDWVDPEDMAAMWAVPDVYDEWISAGEKQGQKVHLSRDPDGQPSLTQTEMKGFTRRMCHFMNANGIIVLNLVLHSEVSCLF